MQDECARGRGQTPKPEKGTAGYTLRGCPLAIDKGMRLAQGLFLPSLILSVARNAFR